MTEKGKNSQLEELFFGAIVVNLSFLDNLSSGGMANSSRGGGY